MYRLIIVFAGVKCLHVAFVMYKLYSPFISATTVGAPVPEHQGYDQPNYQPSSFARPPPYTQVQA